MEENLFFITGRGRSGSWLLKSIFDAHPNICVAPESLFIETLYHKYVKIEKWTNKIKESFYQDLVEERRLEIWWKLDLNLLKKSILEADEDLNYAQMCLIPYQVYAIQNERKNLLILGDKNPGYSLRLNELLKLFPKAQVIALIRDPRDNVASYTKVEFDLNNEIALAQRWNLYNNALLDAKERFGARVSFFKFEDLIANPEETLNAMCLHLNIPFNKNMLTFYQNPKNVFSWNEKIKKSFDTSNIFKWKKIEKEINSKISFICKKNIQTFKYELGKTSKLSVYDKFQILLSSLITQVEALFFYIPVFIKTFILKIYRKNTGTAVESSD